ncbi:hypothetical protein ACFFF7_01880 [Novosphingobium aquiterrae]|uniref:Helix-turn-helix domain-containing protein n=1 Tax=Novosphingobium aquiterrae TaxID=624388 RepID=A0ABV6PEB4_9SPHN
MDEAARGGIEHPICSQDGDDAPDIILPPLVPTRQRSDGWTPQRQRDFLEALAGSGSVAAAARAVGMSREAAYALRRRADARGFAQAWDAARLLAAEHLVDLAWDRAVQGELRPLVYHGEVVGEVRHYDNRLLLGLIAQNRQVLVEQGLAAPPEVTAAVAADWDAALDRAERGEALAVETLPAATSAADGDASLAPLAQGAVCDSPLAGGVGGGPVAEDPAIPPPLEDTVDDMGFPATEAQLLNVGFYRLAFDEARGRMLTNWPAPPHFAAEWFRLAVDDEFDPIAPDPADPALADDGEPWPDVEAAFRTLTPEEADFAERRAAVWGEARAARLALYYRAAFGLATAAERESLLAANDGAWPLTAWR